MKCIKCQTNLPVEAWFCLRCGVPQKLELLANYYPIIDSINRTFYYDFFQLGQLFFQAIETPIVASDWSYVFMGSPVYFGYLVVTQYRLIVVSFSRKSDTREIIESGIYTSKFVTPNFSPLTEVELKSRNITEIPLSYITSVQQVECSIDDERLPQKRVFRINIGTPEKMIWPLALAFFCMIAKRVIKSVGPFITIIQAQKCFCEKYTN